MSIFTPGNDFLTQLSLVILLLYGGKLVIEGTLPLGTGLVVFAGLLQTVRQSGHHHRTRSPTAFRKVSHGCAPGV